MHPLRISPARSEVCGILLSPASLAVGVVARILLVVPVTVGDSDRAVAVVPLFSAADSCLLAFDCRDASVLLQLKAHPQRASLQNIVRGGLGR